MLKDRGLRTALAALALAPAVAGAAASPIAYPNKPVRLVVPFAPGGGSEITARIVGQKLAESLGQTFVVDARPGAAGLIGTQIAARAPADGHTLLLADSVHTVNSLVYAKPPYDAIADFSTISLIAGTPRTLMAHASFAPSLKDLLAMPRKDTSAVTLGTSGGTPQMTYELLRLKTGLVLFEITYKGGGPALLDAVSGQIQLVLTSLAAGMTHLRTGRLKGIGITSTVRHPLAPEIPTFVEAGVDDFVFSNWYGLLAPAATPTPVLDRLNRAVGRALASPDARERLGGLGFDVTPGSREDFNRLLAAEVTHWQYVIARTQRPLR